MPELKQVILVRKDLQLPKGKLAAQAAHASVEAVLKSNQKIVQAWSKQGMPKIILKVADETELLQYYQKAKDAKLVASLIIDAGRTVIAPDTKTCVGIGPDDEKKIDVVTKSLPLL